MFFFALAKISITVFICMVRKLRGIIMKIQAVRNYQADKTNQQSFGLAKFDRRGLEHLPESARNIIEAGYKHAQETLGDLVNSERFDILFYPVLRKNTPAGLVVVRPFKNGAKTFNFLASNNPHFEFAVAQEVRMAMDSPVVGYGTFVDCAKADPNLPQSLWDTTLPLSKKELEERFETLA